MRPSGRLLFFAFATSSTGRRRSSRECIQLEYWKRQRGGGAFSRVAWWHHQQHKNNNNDSCCYDYSTTTTTTTTTVSQQPGTVVPWKFPQPASPPPPSTEELQRSGLPLLVQASRHASEGRILLSGWKQDDGSVEIATYSDVLARARLVSDLLLQTRNDTSSSSSSEQDDEKHPTTTLVAHLNVPGWEYVATQWGAWGAGYGSVPLALSQKVSEIEHVLKDSNPRFIFVGGSCSLNFTSVHNTHQPRNTNELLEAATNLKMSDRIIRLSDLFHHNVDSTTKDTSSSTTISSSSDEYCLGGGGGGEGIVLPTLDRPALILYTSGTTGRPKGVVLTHRNIYHQMTDLVAAWEWSSSDIALHLLPLHHVHGVINLLSCAAFVGARLEFQPFDPENLWRQWAEVGESSSGNPVDDAEASSILPNNKKTTLQLLPKPNILMAVPTIYAKLLEAADALPDDLIADAVEKTLRPMRLMVSGSAALPVSVLERWKNLTGHTLLERYGMTEFAMALSNPYREEGDTQQRRPGYVGRPLPSVQVRLVNPETEEVIDAPGTSGELQVKGPTVFQRYLNREDATQEAFTEDGYFRTGDVAQYDGGTVQSYRILGRASADIIKTGGHKLSALEIERELLEHPDIAEVAVLGIPDDIWGERVAMICRIKPGRADLALVGLREWCAERISKEKVPSLLKVVSEIPKNAMGKVNKKNLAELFHSSSDGA